jgi:hypothetical protein
VSFQKLFSPKECNELLNEEKKSAFRKANTHYPAHYRKNDRLVVKNSFCRKAVVVLLKYRLDSISKG